MTFTTPELADLPARSVLTVDGHGSPESAAFSAAVAALYADAPLEGTWWSDGDPMRFDLDARDGWSWSVAVPLPGAARVVERPAERVARLVHHGPYDDEGPSLAALYAFVTEQGLEPAGPHTETYLTDPSKTAPADLRTELRVPVR